MEIKATHSALLEIEREKQVKGESPRLGFKIVLHFWNTKQNKTNSMIYPPHAIQRVDQ